MVIFIVTRHPGASEWIRNHGIVGTLVTQWSDELTQSLHKGDTVIGTLPMGPVEEILNTGARFILLELPAIRFSQRGQELSPGEMSDPPARLREVVSIHFRDLSDDDIRSLSGGGINRDV